jgi:undecaprenyl-diphosphatase
VSLFEIIVLSIIQGITEFLPISSSAHLILPSAILGWQDQGIAFDVAVHIGTLMAVILYFRRDVGQLIVGWLQSLRGQQSTYGTLAWMLIVATIPAGLAGLLFAGVIETLLRSPWVIAVTTLIFGSLLWYADRTAKQQTDVMHLSWRQVVVIGVAQAVSLIPGTSRSGITMTAGLMMGLERSSAARFSFLMSIPIIVLIGLYQTSKLIKNPEVYDIPALGAGMLLSFFSALICIHLFLKIISRMGMLPFVIYRLALGLGLVIFLTWYAV